MIKRTLREVRYRSGPIMLAGDIRRLPLAAHRDPIALRALPDGFRLDRPVLCTDRPSPTSCPRSWHFRNEQAALKVLYLVATQRRPIRENLTGRIDDWKQIFNTLTIKYRDRIQAAN